MIIVTRLDGLFSLLCFVITVVVVLFFIVDVLCLM